MSKAVRFLLFLLLSCGSSLGQTHARVLNCDIQTAIDKCAGSCTVSVPPGTCHLNASLTWAGTGKKINLECAGRTQTVLVCPAGVPCIDPDAYSRIAHCDLRGSGVASPGNAIVKGSDSGGNTDIAIEDNIIERSGDQGINTGGGALRWTIRNNLVQNNTFDGIFLASGTSDSVIADNIVINNGSNGIDCNGSGNSFHGNIVNRNGHGLSKDIDTNGILISGIFNGSSADHNSVVGNETNYNGGTGINIRADAGTTASYNVVSANVSHDNFGTHYGADGISIDGSDLGTWIGNAVTGNTVYHNQRYGIEIDGENATTIQGTVISSNVAIGNGNTGIIVGNPKVQDSLIVNNLAIGNGSAQITDLGTTRTVIAGNKENAADSAYVIKNDLIATTITSQGPSLAFQTSAGTLGASMTNAGVWSFPGGMSIGGGIAGDGTGLKHESVHTGAVGPASSAVVTLTWATPFADASYDPQCSVVDSTTGSGAIRIHHIQSFSATAVVVQIVNDDSRSFHSGTLYCLGIHRASSEAASSPNLNLGVAAGNSLSATVRAGGTATYTLSVGGGGIGGTVSLRCTGAPPGTSCLVPHNQSIDAAVPSAFYVRVTTPSSAGVNHPPYRNSYPPGTPPGTYTLTVAAVSGSMSQSTSLALTVVENRTRPAKPSSAVGSRE